MALQTFTAGQVLTASQVTALQANDYNQTVNNYTDSRTLTIADLGDRVVMNKATATTITVNTGIFAAGDTLWIHNIGAGVCTITAGTATVSSSGSLALAQNQGGTLYFTSTGVAIFFPTVQSSGTTGLVLLNTTSFSGVNSVSLPANTFTTSYDNYRVVINLDTTSSGTTSTLRLRASGTDNSASNYAFSAVTITTANTTYGRTSSNTTTSFRIGYADAGGPDFVIMDIFNPMRAVRTGIMSFMNGRESTNYVAEQVNGQMTVTTAYDSLTYFQNTMTGTIRTYGYNQ